MKAEQPPDIQNMPVSGEANKLSGTFLGKRREVISQIIGPLQLIALVLMTCEASLAYTTAVVDDQAMRWFLTISMVTIFILTNIGFFYMMIFHHEKLYPPTLYNEQTQDKVFSRAEQYNRAEVEDSKIENYIIRILTNNSINQSLNDVVTYTSMHFDCNESRVRMLIFKLKENKKIVFSDSDDVISGPIISFKK